MLGREIYRNWLADELNRQADPMSQLHKLWTAQDGMDALFHRVVEVVKYSKFAGDPATEQDKINAVLNIIRKCKNYKQSYLDWKTVS